MDFTLIIVLALVLQVQVISSLEHLLQTNCRSYGNNCRTFNDYAKDADTYFTSDSSFYFMKGAHHLNVTLLITTKVVNLSFIGNQSDIILCNGCSIIWKGSSKISWKSLNLNFCEANKEMNNSALLFEHSNAVTFSNASFSTFCYYSFSTAVLVMSSSIVFKSCKFENGCHSNRMIHVKASFVKFLGYSHFGHVGEAIYGSNSELHFSGNGTFLGKKVGAAIYIYQSTTLSFSGYYKFYGNQHKKLQHYVILNSNTIVAFDSFLTMKGVFYFANNSNKFGGAIFLHNTECLITGRLTLAYNKAFIGGGAIYARNSSLAIHGRESASRFDFFLSECLSKSYPQSIIFCKNSAEKLGGAIHLEDSNMTLTGSVLFKNNKAQSGGGISFDYSSEPRINNPNFIVFKGPLKNVFLANNANRRGGAMYIRDRYLDTKLCEYLLPNIQIMNKCFFTIAFSLKKLINLVFTRNRASAGPGIYGGAIQYCLVEVRSKVQQGFKVLQDLMKSTKIQKIYANFEALKVRHCINGTISDLNRQSIDLRVPRGQWFRVSVTVLGEFNLPVKKSVEMTQNINNIRRSSKLIGQNFYNYRKVEQCQNISLRVHSSNQNVQVILHPPGCLQKKSILTLNFHLQKCPPGYVLNKVVCKCQENFFKITGLNDLCNTSTGLIKCPQHNWMKPIFNENQTYEGFIWSPNCPTHLCRNNNKNNWLNFSCFNDTLCLEYHTAILCGACLQNYSLTLSSLKCSKCSSNNYLSLLLVFTLAGIVLIAFLLIFNITVAHGTINGLILYANIINIIKEIIFPEDKLLPIPLTIFLSWLNLDFGIPTCFYAGLDYYSYTWLQFVFPFYLWFLVGLIILACKYSSRAMKLFGSNPVAVLATVVLMSYNKLLITLQQIFPYVTVYYSNATQEKRWKIDPNLRYFHGKHFLLAMFGLFILMVFLIPYIVLISFGHHLQNFSNKRGLKWLIKIKPIFDAYYAPFSKSTRYWIGFLLFTRTCLSITYSALESTQHNSILVIVSSVLTGIALIPWLQHKIYQNNFINVLEGSFFLNVFILSMARHHVTKEQKNHLLFLSYSSIGIAFIEFLAILIFHVWHRFNLKRWYVKYCRKSYRHANSNQYVSQEPVRNVSTSMVFDIREPLLEDRTEL